MRLSVSDLKLYMTCPAMFYYSYFLGRVPAGTSATPLGVGTLAHKALEVKQTGEVWTPEFETLEIEEGFNALRPAIEAWSPPAGWKVIEAEQEVELVLVPSLGILLIGRPDLVVEWNGFLWHVQYKTVSASTPIPTFGEVIRTDWHECFYQAALEEKHGRKVRGTILVTLKKLSAKAILANPTSAVAVQYLNRSEDNVREAMEDMARVAGKIHFDYGNGTPFVKNRSACGGSFRNSLCPYKPVCDIGSLKLLEGPAFKQREERYEKSGAV